MAQKVDPIVKEITSMVYKTIENRIEEIKSEANTFIENNCLKVPTFTEWEMDEGPTKGQKHIFLNFKIPQIDYDSDSSEWELKVSEGEGLVWGMFFGQVIKQFIDEHPGRDPKWILYEMTQQLYSLIDDIQESLDITDDEFKKYVDERTDELNKLREQNE